MNLSLLNWASGAAAFVASDAESSHYMLKPLYFGKFINNTRKGFSN